MKEEEIKEKYILSKGFTKAKGFAINTQKTEEVNK